MSTSRWPVAPVPHSNSAWRIEMKLNLELTCRYPLQPPLHPSGWAVEGGREGRREGDGGRNSPIPGIGKFERAYGMPSRRSASWFAYSLRLPNSIRMSRWIWNWIWGLVQHLINKISSEILEFARGKSDKCAAYSHPWRHRLRLGRNIRWSHSKIINSIISYHLALFFGGGGGATGSGWGFLESNLGNFWWIRKKMTPFSLKPMPVNWLKFNSEYYQ